MNRYTDIEIDKNIKSEYKLAKAVKESKLECKHEMSKAYIKLLMKLASFGGVNFGIVGKDGRSHLAMFKKLKGYLMKETDDFTLSCDRELCYEALLNSLVSNVNRKKGE